MKYEDHEVHLKYNNEASSVNMHPYITCGSHGNKPKFLCQFPQTYHRHAHTPPPYVFIFPQNPALADHTHPQHQALKGKKHCVSVAKSCIHECQMVIKENLV